MDLSGANCSEDQKTAQDCLLAAGVSIKRPVAARIVDVKLPGRLNNFSNEFCIVFTSEQPDFLTNTVRYKQMIKFQDQVVITILIQQLL